MYPGGIMNIHYAAASFFGKRGYDFGGLDVGALTDALLYDMERGLTGLSASQDMIPTWTAPPASRPKNMSVIAIDAGGTNFRSSLVSFDDNGRAEISMQEKTKMPATDKELSKAEFFDAMASNLDRLKGKSNRIGFCFSYAMKITPDEDGEGIVFSKEIKAREVEGERVGRGLSAALAGRGWQVPEKITLINDTKAALLSGAAAHNGAEYSSFVGLILGTGLNSAYIERAPIGKAAKIDRPPAIPQSQIVVCESGKFTQIPQSDFDRALDAETQTPGLYLIEKMCSGAYMGRLASLVVEAAAREGLFSKPLADGLQGLNLSLKDMDRFLWSPFDSGADWAKTGLGAITAKGTEDDYALMYLLLDSLVDRQARLAAGVAAAAVIKSGGGANPARPVCVVIEGTTVLKTRRLRERMFGYMSDILRARRRYFDIITVENAITLGAAIAAC
jgi:hexokinase